LEQKKEERRIAHLIKEQENMSKLFNTRNLDVKVVRTLEDSQETEVPILDKEEVLPMSSRRESQQRKVTKTTEDKNQNGKQTIKSNLTRKKDIRLSKKRDKIEKLQNIPEETSQTENL
jgi:hypothetical protein